MVRSDLRKREKKILLILSDGQERFVLQLVEAFGGGLSIRGVIYVYLARLEDLGLVGRQMEVLAEDTERPPRPLYRITDEGRKAIT